MQTKPNAMIPTAQPIKTYEAYPGCDPPRFVREFLEEKRITIEAFCMNEHIAPSVFERLAHESVTEWELSEQTHRDRKEAIKHLINHIRIKIREQRNNQRQGTHVSGQNTARSERLKGIAGAILCRFNPDKG